MCIENASDRTEARYIPVVVVAAEVVCPSAGPESSIAVLLGRDASDPSALISLCCSIHTRTRRTHDIVGGGCVLVQVPWGQLVRFVLALHRNRFPPTHAHTRAHAYTHHRRERARRFGRAVVVTRRRPYPKPVDGGGGGLRLLGAALPRNITILSTTRAVVVRHPIDLALCGSRVASVFCLCFVLLIFCLCVCVYIAILFFTPLVYRLIHNFFFYHRSSARVYVDRARKSFDPPVII